MGKHAPDPLAYLTQPLDDIADFFDELHRAAQFRQALADSMAEFGNNLLGVLPGGDRIKAAILRQLNPVVLAPAEAGARRQYEHYQRMLEVRGFTVAADTPTVVALRGLSSTGGDPRTTTSTAAYDDTIVVLNRDAKGNPQVTTLAGSTHPGQTTASVGGAVGVPDVNGDGRADVGMIHPGEYRLVPHGNHAGATAWDVRTADGSGQIPGVRDTNQDGNFTPAEQDASKSRNDVLTGVMIHQGGPNAPWSAGCINLSQSSTVYPQFVQAVGGSAQSMKLVILDAKES